MRRLLLVLLLLAACSSDDAPAPAVTQPAATAGTPTTVPPACRTALDLTDKFIIDSATNQGNSATVAGTAALCRDNPATPTACADAMRAAINVANTKTQTALNAAAATYRDLATLCRQKLS